MTDALSPVDRLLVEETALAAGHRDAGALIEILELLAVEAAAADLSPLDALELGAGFFGRLQQDYLCDSSDERLRDVTGLGEAWRILDDVAQATVEDAKRTGEALGRHLDVSRLGREWVATLVGGAAGVMGEVAKQIRAGERPEGTDRDGATLLRRIGKSLAASIAPERARVGQA